MEYSGSSPRDYEEGIRMQKYLDWYNSNDPEAIAKRKSDEDKEQQYILREKQKELEYEEFIKDNPDVAQKCKEQAMKQLESITDRYLRSAFESSKLKKRLREMLMKE